MLFSSADYCHVWSALTHPSPGVARAPLQSPSRPQTQIKGSGTLSPTWMPGWRRIGETSGPRKDLWWVMVGDGAWWWVGWWWVGVGGSLASREDHDTPIALVVVAVCGLWSVMVGGGWVGWWWGGSRTRIDLLQLAKYSLTKCNHTNSTKPNCHLLRCTTPQPDTGGGARHTE